MFNVDEKGLFISLLPCGTYVTVIDNEKTVCGTKDMKAKDRITAYVCTNAFGGKRPMAIIGNPKSPRWFRIRSPPVPYFSQRKAWSGKVSFRRRVFNIFVIYICYFTKPVALLMNNCGPHEEDLTDPRKKITVMTLLSNCTSMHQPMDMGIIEAWKAK